MSNPTAMPEKTSATATAEDQYPSPYVRTMILVTSTMTTALVGMTLLVVSVILPQLQGSLSATPDQVALTITFNVVATAIATPLGGWFANRFGRRNTLMWAAIGFVISTALCGIATSLEELVLFRVFQGAFGAPLNPLSNAAVLSAYPKEKHATVTSIYGMGVVVGPMLGPAVGGWLSELYDWRAAFYVVAVMGSIAVFGLLMFMRDDTREAGRLDWTGFVTLALTITCIQFALDRGYRLDWFESTEIVVWAGLALASFYVCAVHCLTITRPFVNMDLLADRNYVIGLGLVLIFGCVSFTTMIMVPPMLKQLSGFPDDAIGIVLATRGIGIFIGFFMSMTVINRLDPRIGLTFGFGMFGLSGWMMTGFTADADMYLLVVTSIMQGIGAAAIWVPLQVVTYRTLDRRLLNEAVSLFHLMRYIGTSVFVSLSVTKMLDTSTANRALMTQAVNPYNEFADYDRLMGLWSMDNLQGMAVLAREIDRQSRMIGFLDSFVLFTLANLVGLALVLFVRVPSKPSR
ncbi:MAG: DHA2 family efflux MFS transporter permease subunit [Alphaproteobacteria bacterium]